MRKILVLIILFIAAVVAQGGGFALDFDGMMIMLIAVMVPICRWALMI